MTIEELKNEFKCKSIKWSKHCVERMQSRGIKREDVFNCIENGEIIEEYEDNECEYLVFGKKKSGEIIHVVLMIGENDILIVTVYYPNTEKFMEDLKTRR